MRLPRFYSRLSWLGIALLVVIADQLSKFLILENFPPGESHPVIKDIFHISLVRNQGIAFGLFAQANSKLIWIGLSFICALIIISIFTFFPELLRRSSLQIPLCLILGGALGNLIDRLCFGYVLDFLDLRIWPVFNIADSAITVGTALLILSILRPKPRKS